MNRVISAQIKTLWPIQDKTSNQRTEPLILVIIAYFASFISGNNYKKQKYVLVMILNLLFYNYTKNITKTLQVL